MTAPGRGPDSFRTSRDCVVCRAPVSGRRYFSVGPFRWCGSHEGAACAFCPRPRTTSVGGYWVCGSCAAHHLATMDDLRRVADHVATFAKKRGFRIGMAIKLGFEPAFTPTDLASGTGFVLGRTVTSTLGGDVSALQIVLRRHLPWVSALATTAHEYGHAFMSKQGCIRVAPEIAEGTAELFAWSLLGTLPRDADRLLQQYMIGADSTVYGSGFRRVHAFVKQRGVAALVVETRRDPTGAWLPADRPPRIGSAQ